MKLHVLKRCALLVIPCLLVTCLIQLYEQPSIAVVYVRDQNDSWSTIAAANRSNAAYLSLLDSIHMRGQYQQLQVDRFCSRHGWAHLRNTLPEDAAQRAELNRHLIYNDTLRVVFCFLEKVGCTNLKRMLFAAFGLIDEKTASHQWVDYHPYLDGALMRSSFGRKALSNGGRVLRMDTHYKFMFVRHPLERLLSAYRNKIEPPLSGMGMGFPQNLKHDILKAYRPMEYQAWKDGGCRYNITVSFPDFIQHVIDTNNSLLNPHLKPAIDACQPCRVRYNFYGSFRLYKLDALAVAQVLNVKPEYFPDFDLHKDGFHTSDHLERYYGQLTSHQRTALLSDFKDELEFYHTLYPEDGLIQF